MIALPTTIAAQRWCEIAEIWRFVLCESCAVFLQESQALGAIVLRNYTISKAVHDVKRAFAFKLVKGGSRTYCLCADSEQEMNK